MLLNKITKRFGDVLKGKHFAIGAGVQARQRRHERGDQPRSDRGLMARDATVTAFAQASVNEQCIE